MGVDPPCREDVGATQVVKLEYHPPFIRILRVLHGAPSVPGMGRGCKRSPYGSRPISSHASRTTSSPRATSTHSTKRPVGSAGARSTWARRSCSLCPPYRVKRREVDASANANAPHAISHDGHLYCGVCGADCTRHLYGPKTAAPGFLRSVVRSVVRTCNSTLTQQSDKYGQSVLRR